MGISHAPFDPAGGGELLTNMRLKLSQRELEDRRQLLSQLDTLKRDIDQTGEIRALDRLQGQACDVILRGVADAFDLAKEDPRIVSRYDTARLVGDCKDRMYADEAHAIGKQMLLARRLCEAGCGFVTVFCHHHVWDMHGDVVAGLRGVPFAMPIVGAAFDHAMAAFIEDVEARGLRDKILLVCTGEMGRTPRLVPKSGGRDHWANLAPLLVYGGGLKMGQVIGQSTPNAGDPVSDPIRVRDLTATICHTVFDVAELRLVPGLDKVATFAGDGESIPQLCS
jgi:hypothetical protein